MYVAVFYDNKWHVGCIADQSEQFEELQHQCSTKNNFFPGQLDRTKCNIPFNHVLCSVLAPVVQEGRTVFKMKQFRKLNNASNNFKTKIIEPMYSVTFQFSLFPCTF